VYNLTTYPNLVGFFEALGVDTEPSDMSFSLSIDGGALEWFANRGMRRACDRMRVHAGWMRAACGPHGSCAPPRRRSRSGRWAVPAARPAAPHAKPPPSAPARRASVGDLDTVFAQRGNLLRPSFLGMVRDVVRFGREAPKVLEPSAAASDRDMTLSAYLDKHRYGDAFRRHYLLPMCAAVWSVPNQQVRSAAASGGGRCAGPGAASHARAGQPQVSLPWLLRAHSTGRRRRPQVLEFPVQMLVRFWVNHHLLDLTQRPKWRVVKDRSVNYVRAVLAGMPGGVGGGQEWRRQAGAGGQQACCRQHARVAPVCRHLSEPPRHDRHADIPEVLTSTPVASVERLLGGGVRVTPAAGAASAAPREFDAVLLATHSDTALQILGAGATAAEREVLGAIPYNT
jgi:predicted NAD/FAD-binding protein